MKRRPRRSDREASGRRTPPYRPDRGRRGEAGDRHQDRDEEKYHGDRACEAVFARRPDDIVRVYVSEERRARWAPLLDLCSRTRRGFQVVSPDSLVRLAGSQHHEGIVILARACPRLQWDAMQRSVEMGRLPGPLIYLDGVQNPHNFGAILRTAAHFGVGAVLGAAEQLPPISPAAARVAEGAAEHVPVCDLPAPRADVQRLKELGFRVVATSSHTGRPLSPGSLGGRLLLVLGGEAEGVSPALLSLADETICIPGTGRVESLNVSVACGILLAAVGTTKAAATGTAGRTDERGTPGRGGRMYSGDR